MISEINSLLNELVLSVKTLERDFGEIDTSKSLQSLAREKTWGAGQIKTIDFLAKRVDVTKKLVSNYEGNGRSAKEAVVLDKDHLSLATAIFYKALILDLEKTNNRPLQFKRFNVLFKAIDLFKPSWIEPGTFYRDTLEQEWKALCEGEASTIDPSRITVPSHGDVTPTEFKTLPITVLFYESPIARAYLETIYSLGFKPQKIIQLIAARDVATKKPVGKWIPSAIRKSYAANIQMGKIHYWPGHLFKTHEVFCESILKAVSEDLCFAKQTLDNARLLRDLSSYSDSIVPLMINSISDKCLLDYLKAESESAILFTGGGIVPESILNIPHLQFIHIHPGYLPDIRGADCVLWSNLLTGNSSATCFYMSPGIDTGDIISPHWLPKLDFSNLLEEQDVNMKYRSIFSFIDPWVRSFVLREVILSNTQFLNLRATSQDENTGMTYHFMHSRLKEISINKFLYDRPNTQLIQGAA